MKQEKNANPGTLYIVATPIGNLEDITLRALRILQEVDCIAAEDTRHTQKLLNHFNIQTKLTSYFREREAAKAAVILEMLEQGKSVAVVSDAGTPGISDPGALVVNIAREKGIPVVPVPGASALTTALSCSGITDGSFVFYGFPPAKKSQRRQLLTTLKISPHYSVFYESPHRLDSFIRDAYHILEERNILVARELTKVYEEFNQTSLKTLLETQTTSRNKGEYVLILSPASNTPTADLDMDELIIWYRDNTSLSMKDSCKAIAEDLGESRSMIYKQAIKIWKAGER